MPELEPSKNGCLLGNPNLATCLRIVFFFSLGLIAAMLILVIRGFVERR